MGNKPAITSHSWSYPGGLGLKYSNLTYLSSLTYFFIWTSVYLLKRLCFSIFDCFVLSLLCFIFSLFYLSNTDKPKMSLCPSLQSTAMTHEVCAFTWKYSAASFSLYNSNNIQKPHWCSRHQITHLLAGRRYTCTVFSLASDSEYNRDHYQSREPLKCLLPWSNPLFIFFSLH